MTAARGRLTAAAPLAARERALTGARRPLLLLLFALALGGAVLLAVSLGAVAVSPADLWGSDGASALRRSVLLQIRAPRVLLAGAVGAALGLAGAALQGLFRNPLADPALIGVSSGAALGAVAAIVLGPAAAVAWLGAWLLPLAAFAGACAAVGFLYAFARRGGQLDVTALLLAGIAVNALAGAGIGALIYASDDAELRTLNFWMLGSFGGARWTGVVPALLCTAAAAAMQLRHARALDRFQLGEAEARRLGVPVRRVKRELVLAVAGGVGAGVALAGSIGFVGLVVPHLARLCGGAPHRFVLPASALLGALLLILADLAARLLVVPAELPVGLVTSALGAPCFLWLLARRRPA